MVFMLRAVPASAALIFNFELAIPRRLTILVRPHMDQNHLVPEIRQILQRLLTPRVIQKIRDHDHQPALRIPRNKIARDVKKLRRAARLQRL